MGLIDKCLQHLFFFLAHILCRGSHILERAAFYHHRDHADFIKNRAKVGVGHDNTNTTGDGTRVGDNAVGCCSDVVSPGSCNGSHGSDDFLFWCCFTDFPVDFLRWPNDTAR